ncbi:hypothetical protein F4781DRAFT_87115 [Annulohypoxylon bovei var. microspora]|nr:hypothetical protein F4781DRAFT_87115 [Annulohypoxylon bovei var. microspora]
MLFKDYRTPVRGCGWKFLKLLTSCFLTLLITTSNSKTIDEVERRHRANAELLARGQLTLDLFPPLSYLFTVVVPDRALHSTIVAARLISISMVLHPTPNRHLGRWWWVEPIGSCALLFLQATLQRLRNMHTEDEAHSLEASAAVATCLLLLSLFNFGCKSGARLSWARQALVILAGMLGCNAADWILGYVAVTAQDLHSLSSPKISCSWRQLAWKIALAVLRAVGLPLLMLVAVYGLLSPFSETSAGRNHNLHFLDASTRRSLSPQEPVDLEALGLAQHAKHIPEYALIPFLPLSLYVPNAGFLWGGGANYDTVLSHVEETGDLPMAAYFSDPIGKRYPWAFEQPDAPGDEDLDEEQRSFVQSHLWTKALVYLRSRIDHMYLGTAASLDVKEQDVQADEQEPFHRFPIGLHAEKSAATVWILNYDPTRDAGFRLYNPHKDCHLATTFRSTGLNQDSTSHDDSVHAEMKGTLEASCTRLVSKSASTFWAIEGRLEHPRAVDFAFRRKRLPPTVRALAEVFQRGCSILRAHVSLYRWQSRYSEQLELLLSPLAFSSVQERWETWVERLILLLFLGNHSWFLVVSQRTGRSLPGGRSSVFPALFCWTHVLVYTILGFSRPHGGGVELMFALYGLRVMLRQE